MNAHTPIIGKMIKSTLALALASALLIAPPRPPPKRRRQPWRKCS